MTLTSVENGTFFQNSEWTKGNLNADTYILSYEANDFSDITTASGTLAVLNFKIKDDAVAGNYEVKASYNPGDIINIGFEDIDFAIDNGSITIKSASNTELTILGKNVSYDDSLYMLFAVYSSNPDAEVELLTWTEGTGVYNYGTQEKTLTSDATMNVGGKLCNVFFYPVAAKQMADTVYVRAYSLVDGVETYSDPGKFSVLEYAYSKLGYVGNKATDTKLLGLLESMLTYGNKAQDYFTYNMENQATAEQSFYKVTIEGGYLPDGFNYGLFKAGQTITVSASKSSAVNWTEGGNAIGNGDALNYTVTKNTTLTAQ